MSDVELAKVAGMADGEDAEFAAQPDTMTNTRLAPRKPIRPIRVTMTGCRTYRRVHGLITSWVVF